MGLEGVPDTNEALGHGSEQRIKSQVTWFSRLICMTSLGAPQGAGNGRAKWAGSMRSLKAVRPISFLLQGWGRLASSDASSMSGCGEKKTGANFLFSVNIGYPGLSSRPVSAPSFTPQMSMDSSGSYPPTSMTPATTCWVRAPDMNSDTESIGWNT